MKENILVSQDILLLLHNIQSFRERLGLSSQIYNAGFQNCHFQ